MTKNEIVSHNLQLVMDALSDDEYKKFMANYIRLGWPYIHYNKFTSAHEVIFWAFHWARTKQLHGYWLQINERIKHDN